MEEPTQPSTPQYGDVEALQPYFQQLDTLMTHRYRLQDQNQVLEDYHQALEDHERMGQEYLQTLREHIQAIHPLSPS